MTFKANAKFMGELFDTLNSTLHSVDLPGVLWIVALEPLAGRMLTTGKTLGMKQNEEGYGKLFHHQPTYCQSNIPWQLFSSHQSGRIHLLLEQ